MRRVFLGARVGPALCCWSNDKNEVTTRQARGVSALPNGRLCDNDAIRPTEPDRSSMRTARNLRGPDAQAADVPASNSARASSRGLVSSFCF